VDEVWERLQKVRTWEGIGGLHKLRDPVHDVSGDLTAFMFSLKTPLGTVNDEATVSPTGRAGRQSMAVRAQAKGIKVTVTLSLDPRGEAATEALFAINAEGTTFLTGPLASALGKVLESGIDKEAERMQQRLESE